jgi:hypothetical protein
MQIVKTKGHLIYSANQGAPRYACLGKCQKVWWPDDVPSDLAILANPACPQCGGPLTSDIPPGHYSVISDEAGTLKKGGATITNAGLNLGK